MKKVVRAIRELRRDLLIKDQPLKAYRLLQEAVKEYPELQNELERTKKMLAHILDPKKYLKVYTEDISENLEKIEPEFVIKDPSVKYHRFGWIMKEIKKIKPATYLDLACYAGTLVLWAALQGIDATGVELSKASSKIAAERAKKYHLPAKIFQGDLMDYDKKADIVSAFEIIEHMPDDRAFIKHVGKLAKKWAYITTPDGPYLNGWGNLGHWEYSGKSGDGHVRAYNKKTLRKLIESNGGVIDQLFVDKNTLLCCKFRIK